MFLPFFGRRGVPIKLTLLSGEVDNHQRKLFTNFEIAKFTTKKVTEFPIKNTSFSPFWGEGGSNQTDTTFRGGRESLQEAFD